jgi:hypothetical protein
VKICVICGRILWICGELIVAILLLVAGSALLGVCWLAKQFGIAVRFCGDWKGRRK